MDRDAVLRELAAITAGSSARVLLDALGVAPGDSPETVEAALRAALGILSAVPAGRRAPVEVIDLTETAVPRDAEILTAAGVVRVCTGQVTARSRQPLAVVQVTPNTRWRAATQPGGHWNAVTRTRGSRTEVVLTRLTSRVGSRRGDDV